MTTADCLEEHYFVCSRKPNYARPDYRCPLEFYPYHGQCIHPDFRTLTYEDAAIECARRGSIILPIKDPDMLFFIQQWATITGGNAWIGLQRKRWIQVYDDANEIFPLQEVVDGK